ncbi:hypothetical protein ACWEFL_34125 [Streptomyces sp. NPDC004838]
MPVQALSTEDPVGLLHGLDELGPTSPRPTRALQQNDTSRFGMAPALVRTLAEAPQRTTAVADPHHNFPKETDLS